MNARNATLWLVLASMLGTWTDASAQSESEKSKELKEQIDTLTQQLNLYKLKYGTPMEGKSGEISGSEKLSGIAQQRSLALSGAAARDLGRTVEGVIPKDTCPTVLITDDANHATKQILAITIEQKLKIMETQLSDLKKEVADKPKIQDRSVVASAAAIQGLANTVVGVWKLFQSDYAITGFTTRNDPDWIAVNIAGGFAKAAACPKEDAKCTSHKLLSTRYPSLAQAEVLTDRLNNIVDAATEVKAKVDSKTKDSKKEADVKLKADAAALLERITAMRATLLGTDASGVAPIASISPYVESRATSGCTVRWGDTAPEGLAVTKSTIFGKGGKVYINTTAQLFAIVMDKDGAPLASVCRQRSLATTVKVSELARSNPKPDDVGWIGKDAHSQAELDCAPDWDAPASPRPAAT